MTSHSRPLLISLLALTGSVLLGGCQSSSLYDPQIEARRLAIANEPLGDYFIGRRFHIDRTHFWGYLRRPRQSWDDSKLVMLNERVLRAPDRFPEVPTGTQPAHGYDHNREYRIWGSYTGRKVYDPNSNLILPEFQLRRFEVHNPSPGWLFHPSERFNGTQLLRNEPDAIPR